MGRESADVDIALAMRLEEFDFPTLHHFFGTEYVWDRVLLPTEGTYDVG